MSGSTKPDPNGEVRVGVPPGFRIEQMSKLWEEMLAKVEEQLGAPAEFVRVQVADDGDHELVYRARA